LGQHVQVASDAGIDVTSALRGRIKVAAFTRGLTVADMLRAMLEQAFPDQGGDAR